MSLQTPEHASSAEVTTNSASSAQQTAPNAPNHALVGDLLTLSSQHRTFFPQHAMPSIQESRTPLHDKPAVPKVPLNIASAGFLTVSEHEAALHMSAQKPACETLACTLRLFSLPASE